MTLSIVVIAAAAVVLVHGILMNELFGEEWFARVPAGALPVGAASEPPPPPIRNAAPPPGHFDAVACERDARRHDDVMREAAQREALAERERRARLAEQRQREIDSMFAFALQSDGSASAGAQRQTRADCGPQSPLNLLPVAAYDDTASPWLPL